MATTEIFINKTTFFAGIEKRGRFGICAIPVLATYQIMNMQDAKKQKILLPTLKENKRYLVYEVKTPAGSKTDVPYERIIPECTALLGVFDGAGAGLMGVAYDKKIGRGMIRVSNRYVDKLKACLGMIEELGGVRVNIDCIYVSGMVGKAEEAMKRKS